MESSSPVSRPRSRPGIFRKRRAGFTIFEVAMASFVLLLGISTTLVVYQQGLRALDTARCTTLANQIMQSAMEDMRLMSWAQITSTANGTVTLDQTFGNYSTYSQSLLSNYNFQLTRTINTPTRTLKSGVTEPGQRELVLTISWQPNKGPKRNLTTRTYYTQAGIYDYLTTAK